ncbi:MAG: tRNA lysidine(34) synthetase TilS [Pseudomonadota bacterium]
MRPVLARLPDGPIGLAVSGGGDSMALMRLMTASGRGPLAVATVDHGLRPESAAEAAAVDRAAGALALPHTTLRWEGWDGGGNLQGAARDARRRLLANWARSQGLAAVLLGHTRDDQAETVLLNLARGSGVDGLAAMAPVTEDHGVIWGRPLLRLLRADLRTYLGATGIRWVEDPSNEDPRFDRVRIRHALPELATLGLGIERLAATADRMADARDALAAAARSVATEAVEPDPLGFLRLDPLRLADAPRETQLRILAACLCWVSAAPYRPRLSALAPVADGLGDRAFSAMTLHGAVVFRAEDRLIVAREPAAAGPPVTAGEIWDHRWRTPAAPGATVAALGDAGLATLDWRSSGLPRRVCLGLPALYCEGVPIAAPFGPPRVEHHFTLLNGPDSFQGSVGLR